MDKIQVAIEEGGNGNRFPLIVQAIRGSHGLRKGKFADLVGVTPGSVTRWEKGTRTPTTPELGKLLRVAAPEQQMALLAALGVPDVQEFAVAILNALGVFTVATGNQAAVLRTLGIEDVTVVKVQQLQS